MATMTRICPTAPIRWMRNKQLFYKTFEVGGMPIKTIQRGAIFKSFVEFTRILMQNTTCEDVVVWLTVVCKLVNIAMENSMKISHCESSEYLFKDTGEILGHWVRHSKVLSKHFQSIWMTGKVMIKVQVWVIPCILVSLMIWCQYQNRKKTSPFRNFLEVIDRYYFSNVSNVIPKFFMI